MEDTADVLAASNARALKQELINHQENQQYPTYNIHHRRSDNSTDSIHGDEFMIVEGALQMKTKRAVDIFLSFHKVFCIPSDMELSDANIFKIYASGYSRVPVFVNNDRQQVQGILMTRQLMVVKHGNGQQQQQPTIISDLKLHIPQCVAPHTNLVDLVNLFQTGGSAVRAGHMALVCARPDIGDEALDRGEALPEEAGLMG